MKNYMEIFEAELDAIVKPVLENDWDDFDISASDDEEPGYKQTPMYDQLGKVLDSQGNPKPVDTVTTDDGKQFKVSGDQARVIRMLMTTDKVKPQVRTQFQRDMQNSSSAADFFDIKDYHEIPQLFVKRYLG
jgi:hypothetical protein